MPLPTQDALSISNDLGNLAEEAKDRYSPVMSQASAKVPLLISLAFVGIGLVLGLIGGSAGTLIAGGVIAAAGVIPAAWGAWAGMQGETQAGLSGALGMVFLSLGVGGLLVILGIIDWIR